MFLAQRPVRCPNVARSIHRIGATIFGESEDRHLQRKISTRGPRDREREDQALQRRSGMDILLLYRGLRIRFRGDQKSLWKAGSGYAFESVTRRVRKDRQVGFSGA